MKCYYVLLLFTSLSYYPLTAVRLPVHHAKKETIRALFSSIKKSLVNDVKGILVNAHQSAHAIVDATDEEGNTPLHRAVQSNLEIVKILLSYSNTQLGRKNNYDETPLVLAAKANKPVIVSYLLQQSAGYYHDEKSRALYWSLSKQNLEMTITLLHNGASLQPTRFSGKDPLSVTKASKAKEYVITIENYKRSGEVAFLPHLHLTPVGWLLYMLGEKDIRGIYKVWSLTSSDERFQDLVSCKKRKALAHRTVMHWDTAIIRELIVGLGYPYHILALASGCLLNPQERIKALKNIVVLAQNANSHLLQQKSCQLTDVVFLF